MPNNPFLAHTGVQVPLLCGAMYPCGNPELVAAVSAAGGLGVLQPITATFVYKHSLIDALDLIQRITPNPIGMNVILEVSSKIYERRMAQWVDTALSKGV